MELEKGEEELEEDDDDFDEESEEEDESEGMKSEGSESIENIIESTFVPNYPGRISQLPSPSLEFSESPQQVQTLETGLQNVPLSGVSNEGNEGNEDGPQYVARDYESNTQAYEETPSEQTSPIPINPSLSGTSLQDDFSSTSNFERFGSVNQSSPGMSAESNTKDYKTSIPESEGGEKRRDVW